MEKGDEREGSYYLTISKVCCFIKIASELISASMEE